MMAKSVGDALGQMEKERVPMRSCLINKDLCLCYWLRSRIGKKQTFWVTHQIEKAILIFGKETI